jgi:hypothetical protein
MYRCDMAVCRGQVPNPSSKLRCRAAIDDSVAAASPRPYLLGCFGREGRAFERKRRRLRGRVSARCLQAAAPPLSRSAAPARTRWNDFPESAEPPHVHLSVVAGGRNDAYGGEPFSRRVQAGPHPHSRPRRTPRTARGALTRYARPAVSGRVGGVCVRGVLRCTPGRARARRLQPAARRVAARRGRRTTRALPRPCPPHRAGTASAFPPS